VARAILATEPERFDYLEAHDSFYLGADLFYTYIVNNGWWRIRTAQRTPEQYFTAGAELHELLGTGRFPEPVREQFRHHSWVSAVATAWSRMSHSPMSFDSP